MSSIGFVAMGLGYAGHGIKNLGREIDAYVAYQKARRRNLGEANL